MTLDEYSLGACVFDERMQPHVMPVADDRGVVGTGWTLRISTGNSGAVPQLPPITWKNKAIAFLANMAVVKFQLRKLSRDKKTDPSVSPFTQEPLTRQLRINGQSRSDTHHVHATLDDHFGYGTSTYSPQ